MGLAFQIGGLCIAVLNLAIVIFYAGRLVERIDELLKKTQSLEQRILTLERGRVSAEARMG